VPLAKDVSYDSDLPRPSARQAAATEQFLRGATAVFAVHGAVRADAPLLLPRTEEEGVREEAAVTVMTRSGDNVTLPYDLRVAYARQLARLGTGHQRRYSIGRVLREMKVFGLHPK
jgi:translation initiation factor 2-alpha kinase 4